MGKQQSYDPGILSPTRKEKKRIKQEQRQVKDLNLDRNQGQQIKSINNRYSDEHKAIMQNDALTQQQKQDQIQALDAGPLTACGLRQLLNFSFRQAEHQRKLSARFADVLELVREACYYANQAGDTELSALHIQQALQAHWAIS